MTDHDRIPAEDVLRDLRGDLNVENWPNAEARIAMTAFFNEAAGFARRQGYTIPRDVIEAAREYFQGEKGVLKKYGYWLTTLDRYAGAAAGRVFLATLGQSNNREEFIQFTALQTTNGDSLERCFDNAIELANNELYALTKDKSIKLDPHHDKAMTAYIAALQAADSTQPAYRSTAGLKAAAAAYLAVVKGPEAGKPAPGVNRTISLARLKKLKGQIEKGIAQLRKDTGSDIKALGLNFDDLVQVDLTPLTERMQGLETLPPDPRGDKGDKGKPHGARKPPSR